MSKVGDAACAFGTVAATEGVVGVTGAVCTAEFTDETDADGLVGKFASAVTLVFTSTPWLALAHGLCAGALLVILCSLPGAGIYPFFASANVSVCAITGIGFTSAGDSDGDPEFKLTLLPFTNVCPPLTRPASPAPFNPNFPPTLTVWSALVC